MELDFIEIGKNIKRIREARGLKQRVLAEKLHLSDQHISHIETGRTKLSLSSLVAIANALEVDCNTLLGKTLYGASETLAKQEIEKQLATMSDQKRQLLIEISRLLADFDK